MYNVLSDIHNLNDTSFNYKSNFTQYFCNEVNKSCRFNMENQFIMNGKFKMHQIQALIDKYVNKYVLCPICSSNKTKLLKENKLIKIKCLKCTAINCIVN